MRFFYELILHEVQYLPQLYTFLMCYALLLSNNKEKQKLKEADFWNL